MSASTLKKSRLSTNRVVWLAAAVAVAVVSAIGIFGDQGGERWEQPELLFGLVTVSSVICVIAATVVIALADRRELAELGLLGTALMSASVLPLVHGLVTPGVLYDSTAAFDASTFLALPVAVAVASPLLWPHSSFGRWAARRWRDWTLLSLLAVFLLASVLVFFPDLVTAPSPHSFASVMVAVVLVAAMGALSLRQLRFYELGGKFPNIVASLALLLLAATALLPVVDARYSPGYWWFHIAGVIGVLGASIGMMVSKRMSGSAHEVLAPVLSRDPLVAFELGLSPTVHDFVARLDAKDQMTRDHVVRTSELAIRVGERFRMSARDLRDLGLAAMLHDVGKVNTPDAILKKPSRLTPDEFEIIKRHATDGEEMLRDEPTLTSIAPIVRSHHERVDGRGYPDGLVGREIPLASRIIATCDALDAMTNDRQYRAGMPLAMAVAILHEHAGSQWDPAVVEQVISVATTIEGTPGFDRVGRTSATTSSPGTATDDLVVPDDIGDLLAAVDAEI